MAMIATVHPYKRSEQHSNSNGHRPSSGFKIEDVTDDPKYKNYKDPYSNEIGPEEGSLVEYCRLDNHKNGGNRNSPAAHRVFEANTTVKTRSSPPQSKIPLLQPKTWISNTAANQRSALQPGQMAHVIDVEVGQPCSAMATCNCFGFRPHPWRQSPPKEQRVVLSRDSRLQRIKVPIVFWLPTGENFIGLVVALDWCISRALIIVLFVAPKNPRFYYVPEVLTDEDT
ncbi:hypothetical protein Ddc_06589 [Ditylenchus destructor]|nr:hypothetical protein Ddc_06589 [Ditylenchus destructor]